MTVSTVLGHLMPLLWVVRGAEEAAKNPESELANVMCSAVMGDDVELPATLASTPIRYAGVTKVDGEFMPAMVIDVKQLLAAFKETVKDAENGVTKHGLLETTPVVTPDPLDEDPGADPEFDDDPDVKFPEGAPRKKNCYNEKICEREMFYPNEPCTTGSATGVQGMQACASYCETLATQVETTFMSFGGDRGHYAGRCFCFGQKPRTRGVFLPECGAASYPLTTKGYHISDAICNHQFSAPNAAFCQKGCMLNAWFNGYKNAIFSFAGCWPKGGCCAPEPSECDVQSTGPNPNSNILPPVLVYNCKCFYQSQSFGVSASPNAVMGPAVACEYTITGEDCLKCRNSNWKFEYCKQCRDNPH